MAAIGGIVIWPGDKEPEYDGRKLSEWMDLARADDPRKQQVLASEAIVYIGTNGLPWFAKWMSYNPPYWKRAFLRSKYAKTAPKLVMRVVMKPIIRADQSRAQLVYLSPASVPYLARIMNRYPADSSKVAVQALGMLGDSALPPLLGVATNRAKPIQFRRLVLNTLSPRNFQSIALQHMPIQYTPPDENETSSVISSLTPCLHEKGLEDSTIRLFGRLGLTADTAFLAFTNAITAKNVDVRIAAVRWAALFRSNAPRATPELIKCFNDADLGVRKAATNALEKIAPEVMAENR